MLSDELLDALTRELMPHIGPIAKILIKKTAKTCRTREELCTALSEHIDDASSRAAFLQTMAYPWRRGKPSALNDIVYAPRGDVSAC